MLFPFLQRSPASAEGPSVTVESDAAPDNASKLEIAREYLAKQGIGAGRADWKYRPAVKTDITRTFKRVRSAA